MKKNFTFLIAFIGLFLIGMTNVNAQSVTETFDNSNLGASYADGSFVGEDGITWTYGHSRDEGEFEIEGKGIMLRRASDSYIEATFPNGLSAFSFQYRKAFTGNSARELEVLINGVQVGTTGEFGKTTDTEIKTFTLPSVNYTGSVTVRIKNVGTTATNRQTTVDNIVWTANSSGTETVSSPSFNPTSGLYYTAQNVTLSTTTEGATIRYTLDESDPTEESTEYTGAIPVSSTTTIKAKAWKDGLDASSVVSATYTFPETVTTIADLRNKTTGTPVIYTGTAVVTFAATSTSGNRNAKFIQDATGAIVIDDASGIITESFVIGDQITNLGGELASFNGMLQFVPEIDATKMGTETVTAKDVTIEALSTSHQAQLITINNVTLDNSNLTFAKGTNVNITEATDIVLRPQYFDLDYIGETIPTTAQNITGVVLVYNNTIQIVPRSKADIVPSTSVGINSEELTKTQLVVARPGLITVFADAGDLIQVYDILGKAVTKVVASGTNTEIPARSNQLLIVKVGNKVSKVITR